MAAQRLDLNRPYRLPRLDFLQDQKAEDVIDEQELIERAHKLTTKCAEFDVLGRVVQIHPGPVVTTFEFKPDAGVKYNRVTGLTEDLCLALKAESIRIDRIPGKNTVGIEAPNITRQTILLRDIFSSAAYQQSLSKLTLGLGKLINGSVYIADLVRMPHLLIAGATGSGKSVALNCMVCSILYKAHPAEVRFIMIDPKRLELGVYDGIPHLLTPIVTDPKQAANALNWGVNEMEQRYRLLAQRGVRNIEQYNRLVLSEERNNPELEPLPYIIIIVDELADLMMTAGKDVEAALTRLAQMARAIGIHLILATQRPSVDVLTGLIKANFPCRISFRVSSKVDSRTILDCNGAEQLLGNGDSLLLSPGSSRLVRVHGAFISEGEIARVVGFLKEQAAPQYREEILEGEEEEDTGPGLTDLNELDDDLYEEAARFVVETGKASTSLLQRRLRIGYGRAARLLDMMQHDGLIGPPDGSRAREVLVSSDYFDEPFKN
jgi:DNA segregation ATPase FtsK/SpoIIIE, S-DNA-T family